MTDTFYIVFMLILLVSFNDKACMFLAHILNNNFDLPHPVPDDIQGTCWCRRHEGKSRYTCTDYILYLVNGNNK